MSDKYGRKEESVIEGAFRLRDEGKRPSHIIEKFSDYQAEIREIFGIVSFIKENEDRVSAPKNILKTLLSRLPDDSKTHAVLFYKDRLAIDNRAPFKKEEDFKEDDDKLPIFESDKAFTASKWKVAIPIIIALIILGLFLTRKDSTRINTAENNSLDSRELNPSSITGSINDALPAIGQE